MSSGSQQFPPLTDWMTASQIATAIGKSRQTVNRLISTGEFLSTRTLGDGERPGYVVSPVEVRGYAHKKGLPFNYPHVEQLPVEEVSEQSEPSA